MFFNKNKNKTEELEEKPLGYWEEESYMLVIPESPDRELIESISERVSKYYFNDNNYNVHAQNVEQALLRMLQHS